uniref:Protein BCCIP homolog n=1 Tax=Phallusia mammillata TaxID=59560 RepID=A0A6F9D8A5_9ASCI|nr:protein BCCIP homolog [Phallusia mammillata]
MSDRKVKKQEEDEDVSSEEEEEEQMVVEDGEEINIDFEGFSLCDHDHDGIKQLLVQQFSLSSEVNLSQLADALITQNFIGSILKQSEMPSIDEESDDGSAVDEVFALVTCYSLTRPKDELCDSLQKYLIQKCKESNASNETKQKFKQIMDTSTCDSDVNSRANCLGFVCNERFVNVPPQASLPMFQKLLDEILEAKKHKHRARFDFSHFLILAKTIHLSSSAMNGKSSAGEDLIFQNAEEEFFAEHALLNFDYKVHSQADDVTKTRRALLLERDGFEQALAKLTEHLTT